LQDVIFMGSSLLVNALNLKLLTRIRDENDRQTLEHYKSCLDDAAQNKTLFYTIDNASLANDFYLNVWL